MTLFLRIVADDRIPRVIARELAQRDDSVGFDGLAILTGTSYASITVESESAAYWIPSMAMIVARPEVAARIEAADIAGLLDSAFERQIHATLTPRAPALTPPRRVLADHPPDRVRFVDYLSRGIFRAPSITPGVLGSEIDNEPTSPPPGPPPRFAVGYEARLAAIRARRRT